MEMKVLLPFLAAFLIAAADLTKSQETSPYAWICQDQRCLRKVIAELPEGTEGVPLDVCKLNCDDTYGSLWPKPTGKAELGKELISFYPSSVTFDGIDSNPAPIRDLLTNASNTFKTYLTDSNTEDPETKKNQVIIRLRANSDTTHIGIDTINETYTLQVSTSVSEGVATVTVEIAGETFFGVRHGLETLSQVIAYNKDKDVSQIVSTVSIEDGPVFRYRGIMLDTSRNYYVMPQLKKLIDGMSYNKLNVFHWHITDSHSFPMEVPRRPKMAQYGAYSKSKIYTKENIVELVRYARERGVKVIPELDQPAHSGYGYQWGKADGLGDLVVCVESEPWYDFCVEPPCGQLNVVNDNVTAVVGDIFADMFEMFDNDIFHMGGDEVDFRCYKSIQEITDWMTANNMTIDDDGFYKLWGMFQDKMLAKIYETSSMNESTKAIMWTSGLTHPDRIEQFLDKDKYIIQIWTQSDDEMVGGILEKGYRTIFSNVNALYLDCGFPAWLGSGHNWCAPVKGWQTVYDNDPQKIYANFTSDERAEDAVRSGQILGSETPLWSEQADDNALESRIWPRGAAHAERLWSHPSTNHSVAEIRMVTNRHRMVSRGILADRLQPEFCLMYEGKCYAGAPGGGGGDDDNAAATMFLSCFISLLGLFAHFVQSNLF